MIPVTRPSLPELAEFERLLDDIWQTRMLSNFGKYARRFEEMAQRYFPNPWTRAIVNCDIGLVLSLAALELPEGAECLVPSFTFNSTANAVLWNRLRPVFVDLDPRTFNVDAEDLKRRLTSETRAIVVTHIFGSACDVSRVLDLARPRGIPVVVDAAHAYGATYRGTRIGDPGLGAYQVFSFSGTKQVTSAEGGLVACATEDLARRIGFRRAYGFQNDYVSRVLGLNGKLSEIHAALACLSVDRIDEVVERRGQKAQLYRSVLGDVAGLRFQQHLPDSLPTYKDFAILCPAERDRLAERLNAQGIQTKTYFRPLHRMPLFEPYRTAGDDLRDTEAVADAVLCLPMFNELPEADIEHVGRAIAGFYGRA
jgi:dTDP-4-amino-4,6-dideoxy-D-glucose transaminase